MNIMLIGSIVAGVVTLVLLYLVRHILGGMVGLYRIVPVNEAHVRIMGNKKHVFSARTDKMAYWIVPFITKLQKLPLCNLAIPVNDIKLNDKNMAKFQCDMVCFVNISNIELAVERLTLTSSEKDLGFDFMKLSEDLRAIMESIGRTVTTQQSLIDIYMHRELLDKAITKEVEGVFPKWGISLVDLELKDIKDAPNSTIIQDIERKQAAELRKDADIKVAQATKEAEIVKAESEEAFRKRQIEKDKQIALSEQNKYEEVAVREAVVNEKRIEAKRKLEVGQAEIEKERVTLQAEAEKEKQIREALGQSEAIASIGKANAEVIRIKLEAEAKGTSDLADAMKKFDDKALGVKNLDINLAINQAKFKALGEALSKAELKLIVSGENASNFFGMKFDAESGANLSQFLDGGEIDIQKLAEFFKNKTKK